MIGPADVSNPIAEAIQLSVATVFLLSGVADMLNALSMRLARVIAGVLRDQFGQS